MHQTTRLLAIPACLLLTLSACVEHASEPTPELERGLVIHEGGGHVDGSFSDDQHAIRFSGEVADAGFDVQIELDDVTLTLREDSDGLLSYDAYTADGEPATQITDGDRAALTALAGALDVRGSDVDPATARVRSFADVWSGFPSTLELRGAVDSSFRSTTSICGHLDSFISVTHDDSQFQEWDDETTYFAYVSMHEAGPCLDGTWFLMAGTWRCFEPDHSATIEYAYGNCFGRCGERCGSTTQFTTDCANYDSCQRFGHDLNDVACEDEFLAALDDSFDAPDCL
jgi:hypothetical protein